MNETSGEFDLNVDNLKSILDAKKIIATERFHFYTRERIKYCE